MGGLPSTLRFQTLQITLDLKRILSFDGGDVNVSLKTIDAALTYCVYVQNIDPTLLLTAFLPILLFAGAFALEWHTVRRLIWSSLLLAGHALSLFKKDPGPLLGQACHGSRQIAWLLATDVHSAA